MPRSFPRLARLAAVAGGAFLVAWGTITLARLGLGLAPVWPLNGLLVLAAVLSRPGERAPTLLAGLAGAAGANAFVGDPPVLVLGFAIGNGALVTVATFALAELRGAGLMPGRWRVAGRIAVALLGSPALNATWQAALLSLTRGAPVLTTWELSFLANALGLAITAPFLLLGRGAGGADRRALPTALALLLTTALTVLAFTRPGPPLGFLMLPAQAAAALTGGLPAALASQAIVTAVSIVLTCLGHGFVAAMAEGRVEKVQYLQLLLACNGFAALALGLIAERHARVVARLRLAHRRALADGAGDRAFRRIVDQRIRAPLRDLVARRRPEALMEQLSQALAAAEQIRAFTGLRHGAVQIGLAPVPLGPLFEAVRRELAPLAEEQRVVLRVGCDGATPLGNAAALRDILLALGRNGIAYRSREAGEVCFLVSGADGSVRISVEDDGIGIDPALAHRLFRPFDRLGLEQEPVPGLGLGLCHARRLASAMGGTLVHEPLRGRTRFVLTLPAASRAVAQAA
jgi:signal transduction histidine kinase